ncbi:MAG TPA: vitamin K epoxide reductase family protein [Rhodothermales bacterium]
MARSARNATLSPFARYRPGIEVAIYILALLGVLVVVHLWIQQGRGFDRGCLGFTTSEAVEASFDCEAVVESGAGSMMGVSNAVWGLLFYLGVAALSFAISRSSDVLRLKQARMALVTVGFLYSAYLVYYQANAIGGYCALCLISACIVAILFVVHLVDLRKGAGDATTNASPMKKPVSFYAGLAAAVVVLAGADVLYFSNLPATRPEPPAIAQNGAAPVAAGEAVAQDCGYNLEMAPIANWQEFVSFADPSKGNPSAPVTVITYFDPNCPHCRSLHPIMEQVIQDHADDAHFVFKPFPLWQHSVAQVHALYASAQEGKFFEMMQAQFDLQRREGLSMEILKQIAGQIGMDPNSMESRINAGLYTSMIQKDREQAMAVGVRSMPTVVINGRFVAGLSRSRECLGSLIEQAGADG